MTTIIGIDFGTTNSVLSVLEPDGSTRNARFTDAQLETFRSVLCFWTEEEHHRTQLRSAAGPRAIAAYLDDPLDSRLIMSMKSYLAQRSFTQTTLYNRTVTLEQLIGIFLRAFLAEAGIETQGAHVVAGRPVKFVGETADDALGEQRLRDHRGDASRAGGFAVGVAVVSLVGHGDAWADVRPDIERGLELGAVAGLARCQVEVERIAVEIGLEVDLGREAAPGTAERLMLLPPFAPAAETCARAVVLSKNWMRCAVSLHSTRAWKNASNTPDLLRRQKRFQTLFHLPYSLGNARHVMLWTVK
jgi:hypothetical protein